MFELEKEGSPDEWGAFVNPFSTLILIYKKKACDISLVFRDRRGSSTTTADVFRVRENERREYAPPPKDGNLNIHDDPLYDSG